MSIYATLWEIKVPRNHSFDEEWVRVYAQAVPAHIGHPSEYPEGDPYAGFLPPVVEYDPERFEADWIERAVVIVAEGQNEKIGQEYVDPLIMLTGQQYRAATFEQLMQMIHAALPWDDSVGGLATNPDGSERVIRIDGMPKYGEGLPEDLKRAIRPKRLKDGMFSGSAS